jgi:penicillin-binding protein 1A
MTPLEHTNNYAVFANGGMETHAYAIEEVHTLQGELLYSHERDEPARKQIFDRKAIETLNTMLQGVVTYGTGKATQLDYTYNAGKTGTSTAYRDAWFVGFTGQYVAGVWLGNDDFTPMARVTGGSFPAQTWHNFMVLAHDTDNIPQSSAPAAPGAGRRAGAPGEAANRGGDGHRGHRAPHRRASRTCRATRGPRKARDHAQRGAGASAERHAAAEPG